MPYAIKWVVATSSRPRLSPTARFTSELKTRLLANKPSAPLPSVSVPCFTFTGQAVGTTSAAQSTVLTNLGPGALTISGFSFQGLNPGEFSQTNTCGASIAVGASCKINITFTPTIATIPQQAYLQISDNAVGGALTLEVIGVGK
jgi:hypothetical protein